MTKDGEDSLSVSRAGVPGTSLGPTPRPSLPLTLAESALHQVLRGPPQRRAAPPGRGHPGLREGPGPLRHCGCQGNREAGVGASRLSSASVGGRCPRWEQLGSTMEGTDGTMGARVGLPQLRTCVERTLPDTDIFFRDAGVCGPGRACSLLGEGICPLRTDRPTSPL